MVLSMLPGDADKPVKEISHAVAAWCRRLLLKLSLPQPLKKLEAMALDLGFDAMVDVLCKSDGCAQDLESSVEILLLHNLWLADLHQGVHATASWLLDLLPEICGWLRRGASAALGALQRRTEAGGSHRPASACYGRKATLLYLYFPETKKSNGKIYRSCHDAGPSGSSPAPVSILWRSNSTATSIGCGAELGGPDCFFHIFSGVFSVKAQSLSRIPLIYRGFPVICNHRFVNTSSF
jgi:hypothetical protein